MDERKRERGVAEGGVVRENKEGRDVDWKGEMWRGGGKKCGEEGGRDVERRGECGEEGRYRWRGR